MFYKPFIFPLLLLFYIYFFLKALQQFHTGKAKRRLLTLSLAVGIKAATINKQLDNILQYRNTF